MTYAEILALAEERADWNARAATRLRRHAAEPGNELAALDELRTELNRAIDTNQFWADRHQHDAEGRSYRLTIRVLREILASLDANRDG